MPSPPSAAPHDAPAIAVDRLSKLYGSFIALRDVTLHLRAGSSVVLLGPNGAGKSTLLKLVAGLTRPSYGSVRTWGADPEQCRGRIAYMGHQSMLYDDLTGTENLLYMMDLLEPGLPGPQKVPRVQAALEQVALDPANSRHVGEYSQGMRQRAALARVLLGAPDLLLLDEPFSNLDVRSAEAMVHRLQAYLQEPRPGAQPTLLLTTHQADLARPLAALTLTMTGGRIVSSVTNQPVHAELAL